MKTSIETKHTSWIAILGLTALATANTHATDGYFDFGYGIQSKGIGGGAEHSRRNR